MGQMVRKTVSGDRPSPDKIRHNGFIRQSSANPAVLPLPSGRPIFLSRLLIRLHPSCCSALFQLGMKKALLIVHQETSDPGLVGQLLQSYGYELDMRCPALGQALPDNLNDHAAAVVFGGPMSANDCDSLPFIRTELDWIPLALESGKPYLGICLGAQLLARALGATVTPHPDGVKEIGYFPIAPTSAGHRDFSQIPYVYHWHGEGFEVPQGADLLAAGDVFSNQAFRYGSRAYGLQFHPEITAEMMQRWTTTAPEQLDLPGAQPAHEQLQNHQRYGPLVEAWLDGFLQRWLGLSAEPNGAAIKSIPIN